MRNQERNHRIGVLLMAGVMILFALSGCAMSNEIVPDVSVVENTPHIETGSPDTSNTEASVENGVIERDEFDTGAEPSVSPELPTESSGLPEPDTKPETETTPEPDAPDASGPIAETPSVPEELVADTDKVDAELEEEAVALSSAPAAVSQEVSAVASGVLEKRNSDAVIDYSNTIEGYVMVQHTAQTNQRLKVQVKGPATTYTYNLTPQTWAVLPLSDGNGAYQITMYKNVSGTKYAAVLSVSTEVELENEFAPFLHSNQYIDYDHAPKTVAKADELIGTVSDPLKQVEIIYDYVVKGMTYDKELAATVKSGYLPVLDSVLEKKSGICFDYAALMTGMLRSQGVPCKLVVGYAGSAYHAWISVWVEGSGWVDGVIWFNGSSWQRMDPTFASSGNSSESILSYIGDGTNYTAKYFY